jgi:hypothetical protein
MRSQKSCWYAPHVWKATLGAHPQHPPVFAHPQFCHQSNHPIYINHDKWQNLQSLLTYCQPQLLIISAASNQISPFHTKKIYNNQPMQICRAYRQLVGKILLMIAIISILWWWVWNVIT